MEFLLFFRSRQICADSQKAYALSTLPDLKQRVQTCILLEAPFTLHFTLLTFAFHIVLVFLLEWLTLLPKRTPLPQISHLAILPPPQHPRVPTLVFYSRQQKNPLHEISIVHNISILTEIYGKSK